MRLSVFRPPHFASVVGAIGLIGGRVFAEGHLAGEVRQASSALQAIAGGNDVEPPAVQQCGAASRLSELQPQPQPQPQPQQPPRLDLDARPGVPLQFKCGPSETLQPQAVAEKFVNVYTYIEGGECKTGQYTPLNGEVDGATLTKKGDAGPGKVTVAGGSDPETYEFRYESEPAVEKLLCYTCNGTANTVVSSSDQADSSNAKKCTVFIKVPRKTTTSTVTASTAASTTHSTTAPPSSDTSDARALSVALGTAAGVALGLMLLV